MEVNERFVQHDIVEQAKLNDVPRWDKMPTTAWETKLKSNKKKSYWTWWGYEQEDGDHYDSASISSTVTNGVSVRVLLVLMIVDKFATYIVDVQGVFLHGAFDNSEMLYIKY